MSAFRQAIKDIMANMELVVLDKTQVIKTAVSAFLAGGARAAGGRAGGGEDGAGAFAGGFERVHLYADSVYAGLVAFGRYRGFDL